MATDLTGVGQNWPSVCAETLSLKNTWASLPLKLFFIYLLLGISFCRNLGGVLTRNPNIYLVLNGVGLFGFSFVKESGLPKRDCGVSIWGDI